MTELSPLRLNLLRCGYMLLVGGLGLLIWPQILDPGHSWELMEGIVTAMLGALSALAVLGLRYPLQMLPLILFEMGWKAIWLLRIALPQWWAGAIDPGVAANVPLCLMGGLFLLVVPWRWLFETYVTKAGDPWWRSKARPSAELPA
jgi:hypothetical protein